jgi:multiple sugar transport system ATP-binding protein
LFVAQFIGSPGMNIIECQVSEANGKLYAAKDDLHLPLPPNANVSKGQSIYYGIRPEHLQTTRQALSTADSNDKNIAGVVRVVEPTGPEIHLYAKLAGQDVCAITRDRVLWEPGEDIYFAPDVEHVHLFDGDTKFAI